MTTEEIDAIVNLVNDTIPDANEETRQQVVDLISSRFEFACVKSRLELIEELASVTMDEIEKE